MKHLKSLAIMITVIIMTLMFSFGSLANAADVELKWEASTGATSYKIQMSTDLGVTWGEEQIVPGPIPATEYTWVGVPNTGLILFRVISVNNNGETVRPDAGAWFNNEWQPPSLPSGVGIR